MHEAHPIHVLADAVINKIAAGEVVDRPASVLKELLENALDAGATQLDIEVTAGGRRLIRVADDGWGMSRDNALLSIERHATSKIQEADDLEQVRTLGFRGEALAAIASVSQFTLTSRPANALAGIELLVSGGRIQDVREAGCPPGTQVQVRNLFFNVPARRKFLRSETTELAYVRHTFLVYALAYAGVGMRLAADGRELYRLPAATRWEDRLRDVYGNDLLRTLRPVAWEAGTLRVTGYASLPQAARNDKTEQYVFINRRPVSSPLLTHAVNEAYHTLLPPGRHPVLFLMLELDPGSVDVNVHPTKKEVRFRLPALVRDAVVVALRRALAVGDLASVGTSPPPPAPPPLSPGRPLLSIEGLAATPAFAYPRLPMIPGARTEDHATPRADAPAEGVSPAAPAGGGEGAYAPWAWARVLGQVGGLYVILETDDGLVLMDPHAAHERVMYEQIMRAVAARTVCSQGLLAPETVELAPAAAERVRAHLDALKQMGFGVAEFGSDTFLVDALPDTLGGVSAAAVLAAVAQELEEHGGRRGKERWAEDAIAQAACKAAVKARDVLTLKEIEQLVISLARAEMPYTCPHGRPTMVFMGFDELHKKFGRL